MAEKDFRIRKGLVVDGTSSATSVSVTTGNVVAAAGTIGITDGPLLSAVLAPLTSLYYPHNPLMGI